MVKIKGGESQSNATVYVQMYKDGGFFHHLHRAFFCLFHWLLGFFIVFFCGVFFACVPSTAECKEMEGTDVL